MMCKKNKSEKIDIEKKVGIEEIQKQLDTANDNYLRAVAEVQNVKHRASLDVQRKSQITLENFAKDLLPVLDNFDRAMQSINREKATDDMKNLLVGIDFIYQDLLKAVARNGITQINKIGVDLDPKQHKAIEAKKGKTNTVLEIKQAGYMLHNRVIREAMVVVGE
ncbi:MAG: nucleotide exchange factor GrpE [Alphaproteobacteria bacterium]|nr:MAG: nucleotide exchange factor GrpE [Rickettsiaceae bacterium 4572_127]